MPYRSTHRSMAPEEVFHPKSSEALIQKAICLSPNSGTACEPTAWFAEGCDDR